MDIAKHKRWMDGLKEASTLLSEIEAGARAASDAKRSIGMSGMDCTEAESSAAGARQQLKKLMEHLVKVAAAELLVETMRQAEGVEEISQIYGKGPFDPEEEINF